MSVTAPDERRRILVSADHALYARDIVDEFDHYFLAVEPTSSSPILTVDYSVPRWHTVRGWDLMEVEFPALAEPLATAKQYLEFAQLSQGMTVVDLGAYSGFTSILFQQAVGQGVVLAVEADHTNLQSLRRNFSRFNEVSATVPLVAETAIWDHDDGIEFLVEGNMGSAAASLMRRSARHTRRVQSTTLSGLVERFDLGAVSFIKADIEGAEYRAFSDSRFFQDQHPRIIFEGSSGSGERNPKSVIQILREYGYKCTIQSQEGARLPLITCV